jgi:hypothetical protein
MGIHSSREQIMTKLTIDSLSQVVALSPVAVERMGEEIYMRIARRWADPEPIPWLPTQREMDELTRKHSPSAWRLAHQLGIPDFADAFEVTWKAMEKRFPRAAEVCYTQRPRSTGKSWLREQWMKEAAQTSQVHYDPRVLVSGRPEFQLIGWDEGSKMPTLLIDAPDSVNNHFLHRFHKVT